MILTLLRLSTPSFGTYSCVCPGTFTNIETKFLQDIRDSMEPMMFPPEKMLISVAKFKGATKSILLNVKNKVSPHHFMFKAY